MGKSGAVSAGAEQDGAAADATKETMTKDGFLRTGDVGYMDEDGYVFIVDRTQDMLLCGGFNVYPRIIEEAI